nr:unnamed protein product [Callosobruchus analis]
MKMKTVCQICNYYQKIFFRLYTMVKEKR